MHACDVIADIAVHLIKDGYFCISCFKSMNPEIIRLCGEIYMSLQNTCLFVTAIPTRLLHINFRYTSLNVVKYSVCS